MTKNFLKRKELLIETNKIFASRLEIDFADEFSRGIENGYTIPCKAGCSACCHQIVTINITDAVRIANRMVLMPDDQIKQIKQSSVKAIKINRRIKYDSQRWAENTPCSFLVNNSCTIYEDRPIVCRATHTVEKEGYCEQQLKEKNPRGHEVLGYLVEGYESIEIELALLSPLIDAGVLSDRDARLKGLCTQIDLDKLASFMAKPKIIRELNFNKLLALDKKIINSLKKTSVNLGQEDEQVKHNC